MNPGRLTYAVAGYEWYTTLHNALRFSDVEWSKIRMKSAEIVP
jgi:hypothetical protein